MNTYISLLRGINVGGHKRIKMEDLRKLYESLGFKKVQSYIQSGNVLFQTPESDQKKLITTIEQKIEKAYGYHVTIIIKTAEEIQAALKKVPFKNIDESKLLIAFLGEKPSKPDMTPIENVMIQDEQAELIGDVLYLYFPQGSARSKLSNNLIEKKLDVSSTTRNWRSTNKLLSMAQKMIECS